MSSMKGLRIFVFGCVCAMQISAHAQSLGVAGNFNDFIFGNATQSNVDAEGLYAVGGNANFTNMSVDTANVGGYSGYGMITGGNYTNSYATINGGVFAGGSVSAVDPSVTGNVAANGSIAFSGYGTVNGHASYGTTYSNLNTTVMGGATQSVLNSPLNFTSVESYLTNLSSSLAALSANGATSKTSLTSLTLTGTNSTLDVFSVTTAQLSGSTNLQISAPAGATVLVNVIGATGSLHGGLSLSGVTANDVLYNFSNATSLTMSGIGVLGTILAPNADLNFSSGNVDGEIIAGSLEGSVESHNYHFDGDLPSGSPEPFTLAMPAVLLGVWARKRFKRA